MVINQYRPATAQISFPVPEKVSAKIVAFVAAQDAHLGVNKYFRRTGFAYLQQNFLDAFKRSPFYGKGLLALRLTCKTLNRLAEPLLSSAEFSVNSVQNLSSLTTGPLQVDFCRLHARLLDSHPGLVQSLSVAIPPLEDQCMGDPMIQACHCVRQHENDPSFEYERITRSSAHFPDLKVLKIRDLHGRIEIWNEWMENSEWRSMLNSQIESLDLSDANADLVSKILDSLPCLRTLSFAGPGDGARWDTRTESQIFHQISGLSLLESMCLKNISTFELFSRNTLSQGFAQQLKILSLEINTITKVTQFFYQFPNLEVVKLEWSPFGADSNATQDNDFSSTMDRWHTLEWVGPAEILARLLAALVESKSAPGLRSLRIRAAGKILDLVEPIKALKGLQFVDFRSIFAPFAHQRGDFLFDTWPDLTPATPIRSDQAELVADDNFALLSLAEFASRSGILISPDVLGISLHTACSRQEFAEVRPTSLPIYQFYVTARMKNLKSLIFFGRLLAERNGSQTDEQLLFDVLVSLIPTLVLLDPDFTAISRSPQISYFTIILLHSLKLHCKRGVEGAKERQALRAALEAYIHTVTSVRSCVEMGLQLLEDDTVKLELLLLQTILDRLHLELGLRDTECTTAGQCEYFIQRLDDVLEQLQRDVKNSAASLSSLLKLVLDIVEVELERLEKLQLSECWSPLMKLSRVIYEFDVVKEYLTVV
ncbi:hypothetical protein T439DRAFT_329181 [Meredithblackwellia eburnea MCA 4105]